MTVNDFFQIVKKMIQVITCRCSQQKLRETGTTFYYESKLYDYIEDILVSSCPTHPMFKERFLNIIIDMPCK